MPEWLIGFAVATVIAGWFVAGMIVLIPFISIPELGFAAGAQKWLKAPGHAEQLWLWIGAAVLATLTLISPDESFLGRLRTEAISIALAVIVIDGLSRRRANREFKESTIRQLASGSIDFALDAARIVVENGWHTDGSLKGANLRRAKLTGANLDMANLEGAELREANLEGAELRIANLEGANLELANLEGAQLWGAKLAGAELTRANLAGAELWDANLEGAGLWGTNLERADLKRAKLVDANLTWAKLTGAELRGANLEGAELSGAKLEGATYTTETTWPNGFDPSERGAENIKLRPHATRHYEDDRGEDHAGE